MIPRLVRGLLLIIFALAFVIPPAIAGRGGRGGGGGGGSAVAGSVAAAVAGCPWRRWRWRWMPVAAVEEVGVSLVAQR